MIRITKWVGVSVTVLLGIVVLAYIGLLFINHSDEPPSTTARAFAEMVKDMSAPETADNGVPYFLGINTPQGKDPLVQGHAWLEWSRLPLKEQWEKDEPSGEFLSSQLSCDETALLNKLKNACYSPNSDCLSKLTEPPARLAGDLNSVNWMLQRYERLLNYTKWQEPPADSYLAIVTYLDARTLNTLYSLQAWQLAQNGKHQQALNTLEREAHFWRMVLINNKTIIGKLVVRQLLLNNLLWTNAVLRSAPPEMKLNVPAAWQHPLSLQERNLKATFANELLLAKVTLSQTDIMDDETSVAERIWSELQAPLLQPQATLNLIATRYDHMSKALSVEDKELIASIKSLRQHTNEVSKGGLLRLYNPIGYTIFRISATVPLVDYGLRIADLEGVRRMLQLAAKLRSEGVVLEDVPTRLNNASIKDPFTDEAFGWDVEKNAITFRGLAEEPEGSYQLPY